MELWGDARFLGSWCALTMRLFWLYSIRSCLNQRPMNMLHQVMCFGCVTKHVLCMQCFFQNIFLLLWWRWIRSYPCFMLIVMYIFHRWIFSEEDLSGYFHIWVFTGNSVSLCTKKDVGGKNCKCNKTIHLKKGGLCHKEWVSMENVQFVTGHHSYPISSLDVPRTVHLKEGIWTHYCIYMLQKSWGYTLFMPVCTISSRWLSLHTDLSTIKLQLSHLLRTTVYSNNTINLFTHCPWSLRTTEMLHCTAVLPYEINKKPSFSAFW